MKKSYSRWNFLQEKLSGLTDTRGFFKYLLTNRKHITIKIPYYDYLRGVVFVQDLKDNFNDEVPSQFDFSVLMYMLYDDFLTQIKKGAKNSVIASYLIKGAKTYFHKQIKQKRIMKPLTSNVFEFQTIDEEEYIEPENEKSAFLELRMKESEILRGEVLIHDLEPFMNNIQITIEEVIAIVYLDFIQNVKEEGNSLKVQQSILAHLKRF